MLLHRSPALRDSKARADRRSGYPENRSATVRRMSRRKRSVFLLVAHNPADHGGPVGRQIIPATGAELPVKAGRPVLGFHFPNYRARCNRCDRPSWPPHPEAAAYTRSSGHPAPSCLAFRTATHQFRAAILGHPLLSWCAPYEQPSSRPPVHPSSGFPLNPCWLSGSEQKRDRLPPQQAF